MELDYFEIEKKITLFIQNTVKMANSNGVVIGISGGIDSSVVATLCAKALGKEHVFSIILPCESKPEDVEHGILLAETIGIPYKVIDLDATYYAFVNAVEPAIKKEENPMAFLNIKPRLRMTALYFESALRGYLVAGTTNKSEWVTGYYTKYGDGGVDFEPIGDLLKKEVFALGSHLGLPKVLAERIPDAGLVGNQTDEDEFGFTYEALDTYIETGKGHPDIIEKINRLYKINEHKREMPSMLKLNRSLFLK